MVHDLKSKSLLRRLEPLPGREGSDPGLLPKIGIYGLLILSIPLMPFMVVYGLARAFLALPRTIAHAEEAQRRVEAKYAYDPEQIQAQVSAAGTGELLLTMNYHALPGFAGALAELFSEDAAASPKVQTLLPPGRLLGPRKVGWHAHSEDFFAELPCEIIIGTAEGLLEVTEDTQLYASAEEWLRIAAKWIEVADRREPCLLVLDRDQAGWCHPASAGRFVIEYLPDFARAGQPVMP